MPSVKVVRGPFGRDDGDVGRKGGVECVRRTVRRRTALDVNRGDVRNGVDAGVRPAGDRQSVEPWEDALETRPKLPLDRAEAGLGRPPAKAGAVVFEGELETRG